MKSIIVLFTTLVTCFLMSSCTVIYTDDFVNYPPTVEEIVSSYDVWYVDYHNTVGTGDIPYVSRAFTLSFRNGILYANNNIVDVGRTGNGLGIDVGMYSSFNGLLEVNHDIDGFNDFEITVVSDNEIELYNFRQNVSYLLIGYDVHHFDYDKLFYDNIEYFLQEYLAWEKTSTNGGNPTLFDNENYLEFTPNNLTTFRSSKDEFGTQLANINWNYIGQYEVFDVVGHQDLKVLTIYYDGGVVEEFELHIVNDNRIRLFHYNSATTYDFRGRGFIQYKKGHKNTLDAKEAVRNSNRKRAIVKREKIQRRIS